MIVGIENLSRQHFHCVKAKYFSFYNGLDMQNNIKRQQSNFEVRCRSFRVKEVQKEIKSFLQYIQTNNWFIRQRAFIEARGKFGEHERCVRVARGVAS